MSLVNLDGGLIVPVGPSIFGIHDGVISATNSTLDAANEAAMMIGQIQWADQGSHTVDTSGSSVIGWRTGTVTFANVGTTVKVGLAAVDAGNGPAPRATNVADVITFDVSADFIGGGITTNAFQLSVPTTGTKTIANGARVALAIQMTARAGADSVNVTTMSLTNTQHNPTVSTFTGGAYATVTAAPNAIIIASDGTIGWLYAAEVFSTLTTRTWASGDATKEYGQLYKLPFPCKIHGLYFWVDPDADFDAVLYSDPLGTPVAEKTIAFDANVVASAAARRTPAMFSSPYSYAADQLIGAVLKPGASNISTFYKTLASATHRVVDVWGVDGYGISRATGAFADANSGLDHYRIGLLVSAFDNGTGAAAQRSSGFAG